MVLLGALNLIKCMKPIFFSLVLFSVFACKQQKEGSPLSMADVDSLLVKWNQETATSLQRSVTSSDTLARRQMQTRLDFFQRNELQRALIGESTPRALFIEDTRPLIIDEGQYCVIETFQTGERVIRTNYFIGGGTNRLKKFRLKEHWTEVGMSDVEIILEEPLSIYKMSFGEGSNSEDMIITTFRNARVIDSEYFAATTFSDSRISAVLQIGFDGATDD
jgi:hypothetical protein